MDQESYEPTLAYPFEEFSTHFREVNAACRLGYAPTYYAEDYFTEKKDDPLWEKKLACFLRIAVYLEKNQAQLYRFDLALQGNNDRLVDIRLLRLIHRFFTYANFLEAKAPPSPLEFREMIEKSES